jgi:hypothetical protein
MTKLADTIDELISIVNTCNLPAPYVLWSLNESEPFSGQTPRLMTETQALNDNSELRRQKSDLRWKRIQQDYSGGI